MIDQKKNFFTGILLPSLLVMALWGSLFPMVKLSYDAFAIETTDIPSIILFAGMRFFVCGLILVGACSVKAKKIELPKKDNLCFLLLGALFAIILHYSFTYIALSLGQGSKTAIIKQVGFLFLSCFAFLFDKSDKFSVKKVIAGVLGFLGIVATAMDGTGLSFAIGDFLLLLASACSAISTIVAKRASRIVSAVRYTGYTQLIGGIFLLTLGFVLGGKIPQINLRAVMIFVYICSASIIAYVLWNKLLKQGDISTLSLIKFTEPLFAVIFSAIILGEQIFKLSYLLAFLLLLAAILIEYLPRRTKQ